MIALACDHTGIELKKEMMKLLDSMGLEWKDFGTDTAVSCDYPVYGYRAAKAVASGECPRHPDLRHGHRHRHRGEQGEGHSRLHLLGRLQRRIEQAPQQQQHPDDGRTRRRR